MCRDTVVARRGSGRAERAGEEGERPGPPVWLHPTGVGPVTFVAGREREKAPWFAQIPTLPTNRASIRPVVPSRRRLPMTLIRLPRYTIVLGCVTTMAC